MSLTRLLTVVWSEAIQIARDPFLLTAAFLTPCLLLVALGYGLSLDVEGLPVGCLDRDGSAASRRYVEAFRHSRYFGEVRWLTSPRELTRSFERGDLALAIDIPAGFARRLERGEPPGVALWIDGAMPFRAAMARSYAEGLHRAVLAELLPTGVVVAPPRLVRTRYWYNQGLRSRVAFVPGLLAVLLAIVPPVLSAVAVAREKETGSIANLYVTPLRVGEFLVGKQLPYVLVSLLSFGLLVLLALSLFRVPFRGAPGALLLGAGLYTTAMTGFGLVVSSFTRTSLAALMVAMLLTLLPAFLYSGFFTPVASLSGATRVLAQAFPATWFLDVAVGTFSKGLGLHALAPELSVLAGFALGLDALALLLLRDQER